MKIKNIFESNKVVSRVVSSQKFAKRTKSRKGSRLPLLFLMLCYLGCGTQSHAQEQAEAVSSADPVATVTTPATVDPAADPTVEPIVEPTVEAAADPVATSAVEPAADPVATSAVEPTAEPVATSTAEPTAEPVATSAVEPTAEPVATSTVEPTADPVATSAVEPTADPAVDPTTITTSSGSTGVSMSATSVPQVLKPASVPQVLKTAIVPQVLKTAIVPQVLTPTSMPQVLKPAVVPQVLKPATIVPQVLTPTSVPQVLKPAIVPQVLKSAIVSQVLTPTSVPQVLKPAISMSQQVQVHSNKVAESLTKYKLATERLALETETAATYAANAVSKAVADAADLAIAAQSFQLDVREHEHKVLEELEHASRISAEANAIVQADLTASNDDKKASQKRIDQLTKTFQSMSNARSAQQASTLPIQHSANAAMKAKELVEPILLAAQSAAAANAAARSAAKAAKIAEDDGPAPFYDLTNSDLLTSAAMDCQSKPQYDCGRRLGHCEWKDSAGCQFKCNAVPTQQLCLGVSNGNTCKWGNDINGIDVCMIK